MMCNVSKYHNVAVMDIAGSIMTRRPANSLTTRLMYNVKKSKHIAVRDIVRSMAQRRRPANSLTKRMMCNVSNNQEVAVMDIAGSIMTRRPTNSLTTRLMYNVKKSKHLIIKDIVRSIAQTRRRRPANSLTMRMMCNVSKYHSTNKYLTVMSRYAMKLYFFLLALLQCTKSTIATSNEICKDEWHRFNSTSAVISIIVPRKVQMDLAVCLHNEHQLDEAIKVYKNIRIAYPDYAFPLVNLGYAMIQKGVPSEAIPYAEKYLFEVSSGIDKDAREKGYPCRRESNYRSDCVAALNVLGISSAMYHQKDRALEAYQKAVEIAAGLHGLGSILMNLGSLYYEKEMMTEAKETYLQSFALNKSKPNIQALVAMLFIVPSVQDSIEGTLSTFNDFNQALDILNILADEGGVGLSEEHLHAITADKEVLDIVKALPPIKNQMEKIEVMHHFNIQFYGFQERQILERYSFIMTKIMKKPLMESAIPPSSVEESTSKKKKIVFVSVLIGDNEPHGQLVIDIIRSLPKSLFEVSAISLGTKVAGQDFISSLNGQYFALGNSREIADQTMVSMRPDCVIFIENINNQHMHFLAYKRFAKVQILLQGAPLTSGLPSIDFFLSGDRLEHPFRTQASDDLKDLEPYTEQVVLLDSQAISFPVEQNHPTKQNAAIAAGDGAKPFSIIESATKYDGDNISIGGNVYMCFQNVFKISAMFQRVIFEVLIMDPDGQFVLQAAREGEKTRRLSVNLSRQASRLFCGNDTSLCKAANETLSRIHFIPRTKSDELVPKRFQKAAVILQPFPFDGSKTAFDALLSGTPLVAFPQPYLKGRLASTFYKTLALHEIDPNIRDTICCLASNITDYVKKAVRLGTDFQYREKVSSGIRARSARIAGEKQVSFEWARFLTRVLRIPVPDRELETMMNFTRTDWQSVDFQTNIMLEQQDQWMQEKINQYLQPR